MKYYNWLLTGAFLCFLGVFLIAGAVFPDRAFSDTENRYLKKKPEFSQQKFLDGSFGKEYEEYLSDQFPFRDSLVALQAVAQRGMLKGDVNSVYFGSDNCYIERFDRENMVTDRLQKNIESLLKASARWKQDLGEEHVRVMLVPSASQILTDSLPAFASPWDQTEVYSMIEETVKTQEKGKLTDTSWLLRPDQVLKSHRDEELYYRTDHHWTTRGAYYGFCLWMESIGMKVPEENMFQKETVTKDFLGTIHSKLNLSMEKDRVEVWIPFEEEGEYTVYYDGMPKPHHSLYEQKNLTGRDKYTVFLDGNHALTEIVNEKAENRKRLLLVKDSYAHCFVPFAAPYFERIYMVDLRYLNQKLSDLMEKEAITDVLVLYQIPGFARDENVVKMSR